MKKKSKLATFLACAAFASCTTPQQDSQWKLTWEENFNDGKLNTTIWSTIPRGGGWAAYLADYPELYQFTDSTIQLMAIKNTNHPEDTARYLTGGIWTRYKKEFKFGRIEVRARLKSANGYWPAIWMCPDPIPYPYGGEIDIMEHLNHDDYVYQTSHSYYTINLQKNDPPKYATAPINKNDYNIYAVEMYPDSLVYYTNGARSICYPKVNGGKDGQFPFAYDPFHLRIDSQLGGSWVGPIDPEQLPVYMEIDWVRYYEKQ